MVQVSKKFFKIIFFILAMFAGQNSISMEMQKDKVEDEIKGREKTNLDLTEKYLTSLAIKEITPENTIFAFDVHEVLFDRHRPTIVWGALKLFCKTFLYLITHPTFVKRLVEIYREHTIFEGMYCQIIEEYPYWERYKRDFMYISNNSCYPIEPMIRLLEALKEKGFKIFMLSNIFIFFMRSIKSVKQLCNGSKLSPEIFPGICAHI